MKIKIVCVGKVKETYFTDAIKEYSKRLSKFCNLEIVEVKDEMTPDKASLGETKLILSKEAERIRGNIKDSEFVVTLEIEGHKLTSEALAEKVADITIKGFNTITFVIGGSLGLDDSIKALSNYKLSFSDMTFPHQLMRVILLEQIYRAFKINNHEPYHK